MDEDEFKDFDSDNTSDPDGFVEDDTEDEQELNPTTMTTDAAAAAAGRLKGGPKDEELLGEDVRRRSERLCLLHEISCVLAGPSGSSPILTLLRLRLRRASRTHG